MVRSFNRSIRSAIQKVYSLFGYHLAPGPSGWNALPKLSAETVIDVGVGFGTQDLYRAIPTAYFLLVEPLLEYETQIRQILGRYRGSCEFCALGAEPGTAVIHIPRGNPTRSSIYPRVVPTHGSVERRDIPVKTLDDVIMERHLPGPYGIKLDTEGHELEVLKGSEKTLSQTNFVIAEVSIAHRHEGSYDPFEIFAFLHDHGQRIANILYMAPDSRGQVKHADFLFMRPS